MLADGYYKSLPIEEYIKEPGLSKSGLSDLWVSPAHYKARQLEPKKFAAADLGSAVHALVLEPERAESIIVTPPVEVLGKNGAKSTNSYKEWVGLQDKGALILSADEYDAAQSMREAVLTHPRAAELLSNGNPEVSMFWTDGDGLRVKCRPDYLGDTGYYVDLKTTVCAKPNVFGRQAHNLHYHWSAAHTNVVGKGLSGEPNLPYYFIAVEKELPFSVCVFETPKELMDLAVDEIMPLYTRYKLCKEFDQWQSYSTEIEPLTFPRWAYKRED